MWELDEKGGLKHVKCDICGELGGAKVMVGNILIAEVCGHDTETVKEAVTKLLKTHPGPPPVTQPQKAAEK